ncbi:MAG: GNAT family N-acetyltransferase [Treponema sp.]|nr:GNAT family N-acetyltransferase [Treponema sp.]
MIQIMTSAHPLWHKTISFAETCSWRAGAALAQKMRENDFADNERVFIAIENDEIAGFCTFSNKDELSQEYDFTPFIGFLFVDEKYRGHRLSSKLIDTACSLAKTQGFTTIYVMSGEVGLYEKYGFEKLGDYATIYGTTDQLFSKSL